LLKNIVMLRLLQCYVYSITITHTVVPDYSGWL